MKGRPPSLVRRHLEAGHDPPDLSSHGTAGLEEGTATGREPSRRIILAIVACAVVMSSIDATIVATALPAIHKGLHATINWAGWTITIYGLGITVSLPVAGRFSDQFGRRRIFLYGVAIFTLASLACGFATDIYMLIVFRGIQAVGGGTLLPSSAGIVADHFGRDRDRAIGMFGTISASGQVVGPVLGGLLVGYLSWRWIFFINVPIGIGLLILIVRVIPESRPHASQKTDFLGLLLMASFVLAAIFGITSLGGRHTTIYDPVFLLPEVLALALLYLFVRHARATPAPFIPLRLLHGKGFAAVNTINVLWGGVGFGFMSLIPLYANERYGLPALSAGTLLAARAVGMISVGSIATFALRRTGYRLPMMVGYSVIALGMLLLSVAPRFGIGPYLWLSVGAGLAGLGNGAANPASRNAALELSPSDVAVVTGLRNMFNYLGIIFSVSIATAVLKRSPNPGLTQAHILWVAGGIILMVMLPLVSRVPEHKGSW